MGILSNLKGDNKMINNNVAPVEVAPIDRLRECAELYFRFLQELSVLEDKPLSEQKSYHDIEFKVTEFTAEQYREKCLELLEEIEGLFR